MRLRRGQFGKASASCRRGFPARTADAAAPKPGVLVAEAELATNEIQDLAEVIGNIRSAAAGHELKFRLRIELGSPTHPPAEVVEKVDEILADVSSSLQLE